MIVKESDRRVSLFGYRPVEIDEHDAVAEAYNIEIEDVANVLGMLGLNDDTFDEGLVTDGQSDSDEDANITGCSRPGDSHDR